MTWQVGLRKVRITPSCGKTRTIIHYLVYDGDWLRFETKHKNEVSAFIRKSGGDETEIIAVQRQLEKF